jgi:hypothetical protein
MKIYPSPQELATLPGIGYQNWIKYRFNRNHEDATVESDLDIYLCPTQPAEIVDINVIGDRIAQELYETYGNIYVGMSGGIDSEWVAKCFYRQGIPFTPIIYEADGLNSMDTWWAHKWCTENDLKPVVFKEYYGQFTFGIIAYGAKNCLRTPGGPYMMTRIGKYVNDHDGHLVLGAGFPEYFPDPNLDYMRGRFKDNKLVHEDGSVKHTGWLMHEADVTIARTITEQHPCWNFLSWRPEIVLSYISLRDQGTSEFNKSKIFDCDPRPKNIGIPDQFWKTKLPIIEKWTRLANRVGRSEVDYIGTTEQLKAVLKAGDINAQ